MLFDRSVQVRHRIGSRVAGPGQYLLAGEDRELRRGATGRIEQHRRVWRDGCSDPVAQNFGLGNGRRKRSNLYLGGQSGQPGDAEAEQIAAFLGDQCVQFIEHYAPQTTKQPFAVGMTEEQRQLFRRRHQDVWWIEALALAARGRSVTGPGFDLDL